MLTLKFKTITPLHISTGEELGFGLDYIVYNDVFYRLNQRRLAEMLNAKNLIDFNERNSLSDIVKLIEKHSSDAAAESSEYKISITRSFYNLITNERAVGMKFVRDFPNSNGMFYVPGSSVKGSLLTVLGLNSLGIIQKEADIKDKFVIRDSDAIPPENMIVMTTKDRPPKASLVCIKADTEFTLQIPRTGKLSPAELARKSSEYSKHQLNKALEVVNAFIMTNERSMGAVNYVNAISGILNTELKEDEYLINIGFGGGSWFKIEKGRIPMFPSKSRNPSKRGEKEPAHTTYSFDKKEETQHIGWCKLKIIEN
jgi:CRISPR/Cas system CSM-associated protein Csm5 (group 7 of RAMP superfamily)